MKKIVIAQEKCKGCGLCVAYCPQKCLKLSKKFNSHGYHPATIGHTDKKPDSTNPVKKFYRADKKECNSCGFCYLICPDVCIEVYK